MFDFLDQLNASESAYFFAILILLILILLKNYLHKDPAYIWAPTTIFAIVIGYYAIAGPVVFISNDLLIFRLTDHKPFLLPAWKITLVAILSFLVGYGITKTAKSDYFTKAVLSKALALNKKLTYVPFIALLIVAGTGGLLVQLYFLETGGNPNQGYGGSFKSYLLHSIDFFIPILALFLVGVLNKKQRWWVFFILFAFAIAIFSAQGFRWRLVVLFLSLLMVFYLTRKRKVNVFLILLGSLVGISIFGLIGLTRQYGSGLNLQGTEKYEREDFFVAGFHETSTFFDTGMLIEKVPEKFENIGWDPLVQAILFPIPRVLWSNKPSGDYIRIYERLYGEGDLGKGVAVLSYGEYYLAFGWSGVIVGYFLLGWAYKRLWNWFLLNRDNGVAVVLYSVGVCFMYVVISRGYLPQVIMLFAFTVGPAIWLYKKSKVRMRKS